LPGDFDVADFQPPDYSGRTKIIKRILSWRQLPLKTESNTLQLDVIEERQEVAGNVCTISCLNHELHCQLRRSSAFPFPLIVSMHQFVDSLSQGRRRKTKCEYLQHNPLLCVECSIKNTECFSQEYVSPSSKNDKRGNLRERVSKLEAQIEVLLKEKHNGSIISLKGPKTESKAPVLYSPTSPTAQNIVTLIDSSEDPVSNNSPLSTSPFHSNGELSNGSYQKVSTDTFITEIAILCNPATKDIRLRQILMSFLPQGESLQQSLLKHNTYWVGRNYRSPGLGRPFPSFTEFAAHALSRGSIYEVAEVAQYIAFGENYPTNDKVINFIERFILSDDAYMSNLQGLNVGIVHRFLQNDRGEVQRSWQIARQCIGYAQIMGLHKYHISYEATKIWLGLYCVDRMLSLILGRPYGVSDSHCTIPYSLSESHCTNPSGNMPSPANQSLAFGSFIMKMCQIGGRIIDHIQKLSNPFSHSPHELVQLEQELDHLASKMGPVFRPEVDESAPSITSTALLDLKFGSLLALYGNYLSLHIPYMLRSIQVPKFCFIRDRCIQTARSYALKYCEYSLQRNSIYWQTRTFDSYAFAAVIIIVLGIHGYGQLDFTTDFMQNSLDMDLVDKVMNLLNGISDTVVKRAIKRKIAVVTQFILSFTEGKIGFYEEIPASSNFSYVEFNEVNSVYGLLEAVGKIVGSNSSEETQFQDLPTIETWNSGLLNTHHQGGNDDTSSIL
jgi:hypothetical protein